MLKVEKSVHGMNSVQVVNNHKAANILRDVIANGWITSKDYEVRTKARAFLQGYDEKEGWALVEFWGEDFQPFVDHVNNLIDKS